MIVTFLIHIKTDFVLGSACYMTFSKMTIDLKHPMPEQHYTNFIFTANCTLLAGYCVHHMHCMYLLLYTTSKSGPARLLTGRKQIMHACRQVLPW
jgi:hypothetical protein